MGTQGPLAGAGFSSLNVLLSCATWVHSGVGRVLSCPTDWESQDVAQASGTCGRVRL